MIPRPETKPFFTQLNLLFYSFFGGMFAMFPAMWIMSRQMAVDQTHAFDFLSYAAPFSGIALLLMAQRFYFSRTRGLDSALPLAQKMAQFRNATIMRMILLDSAVLLNLVAFGLTANILFLILGAVVLGLFFMQKPSISKFALDLSLSRPELQAVFLDV